MSPGACDARAGRTVGLSTDRTPVATRALRSRTEVVTDATDRVRPRDDEATRCARATQGRETLVAEAATMRAALHTRAEGI
jgi:hypothetical protein